MRLVRMLAQSLRAASVLIAAVVELLRLFR